MRIGEDAARRDIGRHDETPRDGARHDAVRHDSVRRPPGPELTGQLVQPDGSQFLVCSGAGFERTGTQGSLLDEPSFSRERLKVLLTGPEVRPEKP
ncbi:hypothetical protein ACFV6B_07490 [Streptomyces microflavus]|uniref:hypothetical protein n=1 Tax=Streptomyces microflavus TaxID=1919 RepID=UPI00365A6F3B